MTTQNRLFLEEQSTPSQPVETTPPQAAAEPPLAAPEQFQWTQQWYPVAVVDFLDLKSPHAIQLLGKELVIWHDQQGKWHCFEDRCPHRLAPLSEGRLEVDGTLMCAYHAWRFDADGHCLDIPQSFDLETAKQHRANSRSCAIAYPTQVQQGLIWVWPDASETSHSLSQERSPRLIPELEERSDRVVKLFWYVRDLPYGWDFFMENVADPAHVPVSHHGIMGNRYRDANYFTMNTVREMSTQEGFAHDIQPVSGMLKQAIHDFQPPCHMRAESTYKGGGKMILALYASPTRPGWCRHIGCQILVKDKDGKTPPGFGFFAWPMPVWLGHVLAPLFLHQDLVFLHYQEQRMGHQEQGSWLENVYTPNPQDKMVIALRQWIKTRAGGGIPWQCDAQLPPPQRDKEQLFDIWQTHTKDCQVCRTALKRIQQTKRVAWISAVVCFGLAVMLDARSQALYALTHPDASLFLMAPPLEFWELVFCSVTFAIGGYLLQRFSRLFYVYEFDHAHND
ncbi:Rieske 2Fe-2S domain-containing protein [Acaryochloris sp. IP29b_bin.137]|uniref:aromatic ring-hydroxylating dioxygenase subunit alpha n=1 Tax=Acaryochloris sp. IP29b_bin.137 TaxID=2969217 RepID=UPI00344D2017